MGNGPPLSDIEKGQILAFNESNLTHREIARRVNRSAKIASNFLCNPAAYGMNYKPGRKEDRKQRQEGSSDAATVYQCPHSPTRAPAKQFVRVREAKSHPVLTPTHRNKRLDWAKEMLKEGTKWGEIIFSDEKKSNTDGTAGLQSYWHHLRDEKQSFFSRHSGGGSMVVWGCFSSRDLGDLAFISGRQNSEKHCSTLGDYLLPFAHQRHAENIL